MFRLVAFTASVLRRDEVAVIKYLLVQVQISDRLFHSRGKSGPNRDIDENNTPNSPKPPVLTRTV